MQRNKAGGIAGRAGRWSARHKKTAIIGWLAFVILTFQLGAMAGTKNPTNADRFDGESRQAQTILDDAGFPGSEDAAGEMVLVQSKTKSVKDPAVQAAIKDVERAVAAQPNVTELQSPLDGKAPVSKDGRAALVQFEIKGEAADAVEKIPPVMTAVERVADKHPELTVEQYGSASFQKSWDDTMGAEESRSHMLSFGVTLLILLLTFGALLVASVPIVLALTAVLSSMGLLALASQLLPADATAVSAITLIGLAVAVDYSLFYVRREREERAAGRDKLDAIDIAAATSGRAVLISGITVIVAMAGMLLTGNTTFMSLGLGSILVVAVAVLGSLTVLPATLALLGNKLEKGRIPFLGRKRAQAGESRIWGWLIAKVSRRPVVALVVAGGALLALSVPALSMQTKLPDMEDYPKSVSAIATYKKIQKVFPAQAAGEVVVVKAADVNAPKVQDGIDAFLASAKQDRQIEGPIEVEVNPSHTVATLTVGLPGKGSDSTSLAALDNLRDRLIPSTLEKVSGVTAVTNGTASSTADFNQVMKTKTPLVFAFVLGLAFLLLLVTFRSIVIPIKAILLNLLSVGASYGVLKLVFQDGHGEKLLGFESNGAITSWLPLFLFVILFGLSMDYHVFILSRVREAWKRGMSSEDAVSHGIRTTAGTVTAAAFVMVLVFAVFATQSGLDMKQMGVGLAFAILIDATIIRGVLLPASMKLLGDWNWYLPRWLEWLPELDHEGGGAEKPRRERPSLGGPVPEPSPA